MVRDVSLKWHWVVVTVGWYLASTGLALVTCGGPRINANLINANPAAMYPMAMPPNQACLSLSWWARSSGGCLVVKVAAAV